MSPRLLMKIFQLKICLQNFVSLGTWLKHGCFKDNFQLQYAFSFYAYKKEVYCHSLFWVMWQKIVPKMELRFSSAFYLTSGSLLSFVKNALEWKTCLILKFSDFLANMNMVCPELFRRQKINFSHLYYRTSLCCHFGIFKAAKCILAESLKFSWHGFGKTKAAKKKWKQVKMEGFCHSEPAVAKKLQVVIWRPY